jgi:hypothetical protein
MKDFLKEKIIADDIYQKVTEIRVDNPESVVDIAQNRKCRKKVAPRGNLNIVAADHPARGSVSVGDDPFAMGDRHDLLARLVYVLQSDWMDGVLGSMDLLEELLVLHELMKENGRGFLDDKVMIASLNRGGHPGSVWELHDPITGPNAATCRQMKLDGAKMLLRMKADSKDSLKTLMECVRGVSDMGSQKIPIFLEPLPVQEDGRSYSVIKDADLLTELVSVTSALGNTSRYTWLKLPFTNNFKKVVKATTLPIVILGGGKSSDIKEVLTDLDAALNSGQQVRGAMFGRNLLFPDSVDSRELSDAIGQLVHQEKDLEEVLNELGIDE